MNHIRNDAYYWYNYDLDFRLNPERQYGYSSEFESRTTDIKVTSIIWLTDIDNYTL